MTTSRRPRADAVRNAERLVLAARQAFAELGADVPLEEVARRAGVGVATLYRHFGSKEDLLRAILEHLLDAEVDPALAGALADADPWQGLVTALSAILGLAARERDTFQAVLRSTALLPEVADRLWEPLEQLLRRGQAAGLLRADLTPDDLPRLVVMLVSTLRVAHQAEHGWQRYLALLLDALRPAAAHPLPPAGPSRRRHLGLHSE
jgi:AcrR family transcriptional regulator